MFLTIALIGIAALVAGIIIGGAIVAWHWDEAFASSDDSFIEDARDE